MGHDAPSVLSQKADQPVLGRGQVHFHPRPGHDASGETGEYHTVVTAGPIFAAPVPMSFGVPERRDDHWAVDVRLAPVRI